VPRGRNSRRPSRGGRKTKSAEQVAHLLGRFSPLTRAEKATLRSEIRRGKVRVRKKRKK
jgi:hypothetical protein